MCVEVGVVGGWGGGGGGGGGVGVKRVVPRKVLTYLLEETEKG